MYKAVIVEDEYWVLLSLQKTFKWKEYGFEIIGAFEDPIDAIEIILKYEPDVIFTDIRMQSMSGIDFIKKLNDKNINAKFVIISAYANFSYAQEAIKYNVFEYCLKPIDKDDANRILARLKVALDKESQGDFSDDEDLLNNIQNDKFKNMIDFIKINYNEKFQLVELAEKFNLNTNYCCKLFKKYFDCSFSDYITKLKMEEAAYLLKNSKISINDISVKVGYSDYYYFNKVFKKFYNLTPYKYRNQN